jgi:TM2 domain-containing membrane protein YozV
MGVGEESEGKFCYFHPQTLAVANCTDCGKPVCSVCLKRVNTKPYCEACAANHHEQSPLLAFVFAFLVPGMGQVYNGDWQKGLVIFLTGWLVLPWIYGIVDAVTVANEIRNGVRKSATVPPGYLLLALKFGIVPFACIYFGIVFALMMAVFGFVKLLLKLG